MKEIRHAHPVDFPTALAHGLFSLAGYLAFPADYKGYRTETGASIFILSEDAKHATRLQIEKALFQWGSVPVDVDAAGKTFTATIAVARYAYVVMLDGILTNRGFASSDGGSAVIQLNNPVAGEYVICIASLEGGLATGIASLNII